MEDKGSKTLYLSILMVFLPFIAFLYSVYNIRNVRYHFIILVFSFLYGYSVYMYSGDILGYNQTYTEMVHLNAGDFGKIIVSGYIPDKVTSPSLTVHGQPDIYATSMMFLVSRFTDNSRWFFAIVSLIYTAIFIKFLQEVLKELKWQGNFAQITFLSFLILIVPFYVGVTGIRFWTALFLFMLSLMKFIRTKQPKFILLSALSVLVHFSFFIPLAVLVLSLIIKVNRRIATFLIFIAVVFFALTDNSQVLNMVSSSSRFFSESTIESRIEGYSSEDTLAQRQEAEAQGNWYARLRPKIIFYALLAAFLLEYFGILRWQTNEFLERLNSFYILFVIVVLFTYNFGSMGRFAYIFYLMTFVRYTVIAGLSSRNGSSLMLSYALVPILLLHIAVSFRAGFYTVDPLLAFGNSLSLLLFHSDISLSELLVGH